MNWINEVGGLLLSAVGFIVAIGVLVSVHEFGHFWVARRLGIRVLRFSIGFFKPLYVRTLGKKDPFEFVIAAVPLGGYVKFLDDRDGLVSPQEAEGAFYRAPPWKRIAVLLAGPMCNLLLAIFLYWALFTEGVPAPRPIIGAVAGDSIAARAGMRENDLIIAVAGERVDTWDDAIMGLVDQLTSVGDVDLVVRRESGGESALRLLTHDTHRSLTEPDKLLVGLGFQPRRPRIMPLIGEVAPGRPAAQAGVQTGDYVVSFDGRAVGDFGEFQGLIESRAHQTVPMVVRRNGELRELSVTVGAETVGERTVGRIGVGVSAQAAMPPSPEDMTLQKYGPVEALQQASLKTWEMSVFTLRMVGRIIAGNVSPKAMSGPISIAELTGKAVRYDFRQYLILIALISISVGVLNLLPIPMLDGGQIAYQLVELIKGRPVSQRVQDAGQRIGLFILILVIMLVSYNDIARYFSS
jgi:regulator of sigma E protease